MAKPCNNCIYVVYKINCISTVSNIMISVLYLCEKESLISVVKIKLLITRHSHRHSPQ